MSASPHRAGRIAGMITLTLLVLAVFFMPHKDIVISTKHLPVATMRDNGSMVPETADTASHKPVLSEDGKSMFIDFKLLDQARQPDFDILKITYPPEIEKLEGKRVSIIGFMAPFESLEDMSTCILLPSYVGCFFCRPPSFTQVIFVHQHKEADGAKRPFIQSPSLVTGTLLTHREGSTHPAHQMEFVYVLEDAEVVPYHGDNAPVRVPGHWQQGNIATASPGSPVKPEDLVPTVATVRGLPVKKIIRLTHCTPNELEAAVGMSIDALRPSEGWELRQKAYAALGLITPGQDLRRTLQRLALQHTVGYVNPAGDHIHFLKDFPINRPAERMEIVKLITEALIRQNLDLPPLATTRNDDERCAARALLHGDLLQTVQRYAAHEQLFMDPASEAFLSPFNGYPAATTALQQLEALPYQMGSFFLDQTAADPAALAAFYARPPRSTAEIMHMIPFIDQESWQPHPVPADFATKLRREPPVSTGVLGEAGLLVWLANGQDIGEFMSEAEGWRGDRLLAGMTAHSSSKRIGSTKMKPPTF